MDIKSFSRRNNIPDHLYNMKIKITGEDFQELNKVDFQMINNSFINLKSKFDDLMKYSSNSGVVKSQYARIQNGKYLTICDQRLSEKMGGQDFCLGIYDLKANKMSTDISLGNLAKLYTSGCIERLQLRLAYKLDMLKSRDYSIEDHNNNDSLNNAWKTMFKEQAIETKKETPTSTPNNIIEFSKDTLYQRMLINWRRNNRTVNVEKVPSDMKDLIQTKLSKENVPNVLLTKGNINYIAFRDCDTGNVTNVIDTELSIHKDEHEPQLAYAGYER